MRPTRSYAFDLVPASSKDGQGSVWNPTRVGQRSDSKTIENIEAAKRLKMIGNQMYEGLTCHDEENLREIFVIFSACIKKDAPDPAYWLNRSQVAFDLQLYSRCENDASAALHCIEEMDSTGNDFFDYGFGSRRCGSRIEGVAELPFEHDIVSVMKKDLGDESKRLRAKALLQRGEARKFLGLFDRAGEGERQRISLSKEKRLPFFPLP
ncbi:hypothetical protein IE53DRAFT_58782 [Violaceomyces palustris]|uniref:Uncharacterized protein n=1 Tax=Violaceomyces palustris TaxID=1673888 RepID=A0ACD0NZM8_9BASI|nr:hypothetical protein IE53DRAFT_58782 [Violaceomyces palustris]